MSDERLKNVQQKDKSQKTADDRPSRVSEISEDEFENLKKDFADFFSKTSVHFTALEKSNIADLRDDVDAEKTYNKALHSAMKSKDKSRIKKLLS